MMNNLSFVMSVRSERLLDDFKLNSAFHQLMKAQNYDFSTFYLHVILFLNAIPF